MTVHMHLTSSGWKERHNGAIKQRGTCWLECENLIKSKNTNEISHILQQQNGFYALVWQQGNTTYAAVDHIRSIPLFYTLKDGEFYLSDNAEWVRRELGDFEMDAMAREEFLLAGYVTGRDTLFSNVKQLQAGEYLIAEADASGNISLSCERYFRFVHEEPAHYSYEDILKNIDAAAVNSVQRLIEYANGRQILVPLSGGYDSRLIASLLKRAGYMNVLCFSYGIAKNKEAEYSQQIAQSLDFAWQFVEYTHENWSVEWRTRAAEEYRAYASNHTSLPHIQDWLAVKNLVESEIVHSDAVIAPGHCCVTGYIPKDILSRKFSKKEYVQNIVKTHFSGRPIECGEVLSEKALTKKILSHNINFCDKGGIASSIMEFNWSERQAKYITNSVRAYEQFGIDWWLPLWDTEFVNAWLTFPLKLRLERAFYKGYVTEVYNSVVSNPGERVSGNSADKGYLYTWSRSVILRLVPASIIKLVKSKRNANLYKNHFLGFGGLMQTDELESFMKSNYTIIGAYSSLFIDGRWGQNDKDDRFSID